MTHINLFLSLIIRLSQSLMQSYAVALATTDNWDVT